MNRRLLGRSAAGLMVFAIWTVVVSIGISHGSRPSVQIFNSFGRWPAVVSSVRHTPDIQFSISATYAPTGTALPADGVPPPPSLVGQAVVGTAVSRSDSSYISGTRVTTGIRSGPLTSMAVYVAGPVDRSPRNQFQLAIYTDADGAPARRLATTATGVLTADAWNALGIDAVLRPRTPYWLLYTTNGSRARMNNATFTPVSGSVLDEAIRAHPSLHLAHIATQITWLGNNLPTTTMVVLVSLLAARRRAQAAVALLAGFALALLVALVLREVAFAPFRLYPSGHALRTTYVAVSAAFVVPRRAVCAGGALLVLLVTVSAVYTNGHHSDEIIGGMLLGWSMSTAARAFGGAGGRSRSLRMHRDLPIRPRWRIVRAARTPLEWDAR